MALYGGLPTWRRASSSTPRSSRTSRSFLRSSPWSCVAADAFGAARAVRRRRSCGWRPSWDGRICSPAFPGCCSGTARSTCLPIAQLASLRASTASRRSSRAASAGGSPVVAPREAEGTAASCRSQPSWRCPWSIGDLGRRAREPRCADWRGGDAASRRTLQGNVDQAEKWNPASRAAQSSQHYLADDATGDRPRRRSSCCGPSRRRRSISTKTATASASDPRRSPRRRGVPLLIGSDQIERGAPTRYYNSAFLVRDDGSTGGVYRKMHLVPFGEYVPLRRVLFFAAPLVEAVVGFLGRAVRRRCCRSADI